ncbi:MAG: AGE family epimerase/isomerase [Halodesulfurarchaeum sp.]
MAIEPADVRDEYLPRLEENLTENVLDFWFPRSIDEEYGGFITSYDAEGEFAGTDHKQIVTQARMVWLASRLAREGFGEEYLDIAEQGYEFLVEEMWDDEHGGFVWEVAPDGTTTKPNRHLYGQSFGLYSLSEYARVTGEDEPAELAFELVDLLESEAKDEQYGGYVEYFEPDWTPITEGRTYLEAIEPDWSPKESGDAVLDPTLKLMNTHLHLMEAFTTYYDVFGTDLGRERLQELLTINTNTVVRKRLGACTDKYEPDWTPKLDAEEFRIVSYGHDLEMVWLAAAACDSLGLAPSLFVDLFETLWDYSLEYGYDDEDGGVYFYGGFEEPASFRIKAWWVQAEALTSAIKTYRLTGDSRYLDVFTALWDFIEEYQVDDVHGEWHSGVDEDGSPLGRKGAVYKAAYHNGRALIESIAELKQL